MKITVLGCGALGQLWLAALSHRGHNVQGWLKVSKLFCTVNIISPKGEEKRLQLPTNNTDHLTKSDLLLVTLKAWQVSGAVRALLPQLRTDCIILLLHNGLGTLEELPILMQPIIIGTTTHASHREGEKIHHIYAGTTHIGPGNSQAQRSDAMAEVLHNALPKVIWHNNIAASSWVKLAANCVINPLTAIYDCCNGELKRYPAKIEAICREVAMVMNCEGYHTHYESLLFYVDKVIQNTADNFSSMLKDIRAKRQSEIDYITGYVLRHARMHKLDIPENKQLFHWVKRKEKNYG
ncbi:MAG: 2-dehydropantoate 2-reductase [Sodalis sp. (in: enterobacteria)]